MSFTRKYLLLKDSSYVQNSALEVLQPSNVWLQLISNFNGIFNADGGMLYELLKDSTDFESEQDHMPLSEF